MKKTIKATIRYKVDSGHPDIKYIKNPAEVQTFTDRYTIDSDYFYSTDDIYTYIKRDLAIVAGGGYNTDHIHDISFTFV